MAYLSPEWLARLPGGVPEGVIEGSVEDRPGGDDPPGGSTAGRPERAGRGPVTLRHVVRGAPGGEAAYDLRVAGGTAAAQRVGEGPADVTFTSDYGTAAAIASGSLSTQEALTAGRLKMRGDLRALAEVAAAAGADALPPGLREETEFPQ